MKRKRRNTSDPSASPHHAIAERKVDTLPVEGSNSLADLAARINAEHEAVGHALKCGLHHAIAAGNLLIEAKAQLNKHGRWLPWLKEHCQIPERSAQRYMELARHAPAKSANLADLTIELPPPTEPDWDDVDSILAWSERRLDAPFTSDDIDWGNPDHELNLDWVQTKLAHQVGLPWTANWCFSVAEMTEDGCPALRLCPWGDLLEAAKALASIVNGKRAVKFDGFADIRSMQGAIAVVEVEAMWMLGNVLNEMQHREHISDERYACEWEETHSHVMARLDDTRARLAGLITG